MRLRRVLEDETLEQVGFRSPVTAQLSATVAQAIEIMQRHGVGCLLVVEGEELRGIFTERDLVRRVLVDQVPYEGALRDVMTPDPVVARHDEPIADVLKRMYSGGFRHLPVLDGGGGLVGAISIKRVISHIADHYAEAVYNLPPEPGHYGVEREGA